MQAVASTCLSMTLASWCYKFHL